MRSEDADVVPVQPLMQPVAQSSQKPPLQSLLATLLQAPLQPLPAKPLQAPQPSQEQPLQEQPQEQPQGQPQEQPQGQPQEQPQQEPKPRRYRICFTRFQLQELEAYFQRVQYPDLFAR